MNKYIVLSDEREIDLFVTAAKGRPVDLWLAHAGYETLEQAARENFVKPSSIAVIPA